MKNIKLLSLGTAIIITVSMLVACSNNSGENAPTTEKETTQSSTTGGNEVTTGEQKTTEAVTEAPTDAPTEAPAPSLPAEFEDAVLIIYQDGLVSPDVACVVQEGNTIYVDITNHNSTHDIILIKDEATGEYLLKLDLGFEWLEGFAAEVNGKDAAPYNKALLLATLSMVSSEPQTIFERIDMDFHSAWGLGDTEWEKVGDCSIICVYGSEEYFQYKIKKN